MKPAAFAYTAASTLEDALRELAAAPEESHVLAGGQSLVLEMNHRAVRPTRLVDINTVPHLGLLQTDDAPDDGARLRVGPLVRHRAFEQPVDEGPLGRLLALAAHCLAHPPIRARGTMLGSLAYAHPTAEWPTLAVTLGAELDLRSVLGHRTLAAEEFLAGPFTTALAPGEMLTEARFPVLPSATGVAFLEHRPTAAGFAVLSVAVALRVADGTVVDARIGLAGAAPRPVRAPAAEGLLTGRPPTDEAITEAAAASAETVADPPADPPAGIPFRQHAVRVLTQRALHRARDDLTERT
ncbi:FAD binding domain-containing protein [Actinacidiphila acidipaludis]|uniref:FAD binding domain-containing protein n=1 Tax=Actinacidiphila acidipaludis TaxID=2873382 RepID=A0ABS7QEF1_9ACTN|nr:FAD binding domain-containing protein [Streptomyces acidipaludis]MBY8881074.1 FAD binding domain-containing protein [Streptomyces acidipaludis]